MKRPSDNVFKRYFSGKASVDEASEVLDWLGSEAGQAFFHQHIDKDFKDLERKDLELAKPKITPDEILRKARERVSSKRTTEFRPFPSNYNRWVAAAAVLLILVVSVFTIFLKPETGKYIVHQTLFGETQEVWLPDGSYVFLSGNSTLSYPKSWADEGKREVFFEGEGIFEIKKEIPRSDFIVNTDHQFSVQVMGTIFSLTARETASKVVLESGLVGLNVSGGKGEKIILNPGEMAHWNKEEQSFIKQEVNPAIYTHRKNNKIVLDETSLGEIIRILEDDYGFSVMVENEEALKKKFTGVVPSDNAQTLLYGLKTLINIEFSMDDKTITIPNQ